MLLIVKYWQYNFKFIWQKPICKACLPIEWKIALKSWYFTNFRYICPIEKKYYLNPYEGL